MPSARSQLLSLPFLSLYVASISAMTLNFERESWQSAGWFPVAVGLTAALAIIPLRLLLQRHLLDRSNGNGFQAGFFFVVGAFPLAAIPFLGKGHLLAIFGAITASVLSGLAGVATLLQWPGFRSPPNPNECSHCGYDLAGNLSGICPECGAACKAASPAGESPAAGN
jgi:hypothetical protein